MHRVVLYGHEHRKRARRIYALENHDVLYCASESSSARACHFCGIAGRHFASVLNPNSCASSWLRWHRPDLRVQVAAAARPTVVAFHDAVGSRTSMTWRSAHLLFESD